MNAITRGKTAFIAIVAAWLAQPVVAFLEVYALVHPRSYGSAQELMLVGAVVLVYTVPLMASILAVALYLQTKPNQHVLPRLILVGATIATGTALLLTWQDRAEMGGRITLVGCVHGLMAATVFYCVCAWNDGSNNRIERRVNDKVPHSSMGARGAHAER